MKIEFSNRQLLIVWGKVVGGYSHWGFSYCGKEFWTYGTLTEAKKECRKHIRETVDPKDFMCGITVEILP